jgi:hypothetical protein
MGGSCAISLFEREAVSALALGEKQGAEKRDCLTQRRKDTKGARKRRGDASYS